MPRLLRCVLQGIYSMMFNGCLSIYVTVPPIDRNVLHEIVRKGIWRSNEGNSSLKAMKTGFRLDDQTMKDGNSIPACTNSHPLNKVIRQSLNGNAEYRNLSNQNGTGSYSEDDSRADWEHRSDGNMESMEFAVRALNSNIDDNVINIPGEFVIIPIEKYRALIHFTWVDSSVYFPSRCYNQCQTVF